MQTSKTFSDIRYYCLAHGAESIYIKPDVPGINRSAIADEMPADDFDDEPIKIEISTDEDLEVGDRFYDNFKHCYGNL